MKIASRFCLVRKPTADALWWKIKLNNENEKQVWKPNLIFHRRASAVGFRNLGSHTKSMADWTNSKGVFFITVILAHTHICYKLIHAKAIGTVYLGISQRLKQPTQVDMVEQIKSIYMAFLSLINWNNKSSTLSIMSWFESNTWQIRENWKANKLMENFIYLLLYIFAVILSTVKSVINKGQFIQPTFACFILPFAEG